MLNRLFNLLKKRPQRLSEIAQADLCIVYPRSTDVGWILDAIGDEIRDFLSQSRNVVTCRGDDDCVPNARSYFYCHWGIYRDLTAVLPDLRAKRNFLFFTHPKSDWLSAEDKAVLAAADGIVSMCTPSTMFLRSQGVSSARITTEILGCDQQMFQYNGEPRGGVCLSSRFYRRKNPDLLHNIVKALPDVEFRLAGRDWSNWDGFPKLEACQNFSIVQIPFNAYPQFYRQSKVFLSTSQVEGGPMPLLESMNSDCIPVVSETGFASDVISHGTNGLIYRQDDSVEHISNLIMQALDSDFQVRDSVSSYTWARFGESVGRFIDSGEQP